LEKLLNNNYEEFKILNHNGNEKHYREIESSDYESILRKIVPIQMKMTKMNQENIKYISNNRIVYKISDYVYLGITAFDADFKISEKYMVIQKSDSPQNKYEVATGMHYTGNIIALLPSSIILRWNKSYYMINAFGASF
jgi:hypothetical protein